jgi:hypothetical protein
VLAPLSLGPLQRPAHEGAEPARDGLGIARCHPELSRRRAAPRSRRRLASRRLWRRLASQRLRRRRWLRVSGPRRRRRTVASVASACRFRRRSAREIAEHRDDRRVPRRAHGRGRWKIVLQPHLSHRLAAYPGGSGCASRMSPAKRRGVPATPTGAEQRWQYSVSPGGTWPGSLRRVSGVLEHSQDKDPPRSVPPGRPRVGGRRVCPSPRQEPRQGPGPMLRA